MIGIYNILSSSKSQIAFQQVWKDLIGWSKTWLWGNRLHFTKVLDFDLFEWIEIAVPKCCVKLAGTYQTSLEWRRGWVWQKCGILSKNFCKSCFCFAFHKWKFVNFLLLYGVRLENRGSETKTHPQLLSHWKLDICTGWGKSDATLDS